jgi:hypothetical protein
LAQGLRAQAWWPACAVQPTGVAGLGGPGAQRKCGQALVTVASTVGAVWLPPMIQTTRYGAVADASLC